MNERIKELAEQARESATTRHPVSNITLSVNSELFEQKFAELIVRECVSEIRKQGDGDIFDDWDCGYNCGINSSIEAIKKHFGVKE